MTPALYLFFVLSFLYIQSNAFESNTTQLEDLTKSVSDFEGKDNDKSSENENRKVKIDNDDKINDKPTTKDVDQADKQKQLDEDQVRQKRDYNFNGFPYPPIYPTFPPRNDGPTDGMYGLEDPLVHIHRRLSDIATVVRQSTIPPTPPATRYPLFVPLVYIPHNLNCGCTPNENRPRPRPKPRPTPPKENKPPASNQSPTSSNDGVVPIIGTPSRGGPEILDNRNWGILTNETIIEDSEDFSRPISFDPIPPVTGIKRPPPPVEHGSVEGNIYSTPSISAAVPPIAGIKRPAPPVEYGAPEGVLYSFPSTPAPVPPVAGIKRPTTPVENESVEGNIYYSSSVSTTTSPRLIGRDTDTFTANPEKPSICDGAVLTCCHQAKVRYDCFVAQGCPDVSSYGNPCDVNVILRVVQRFQRFYGSRKG